MTTRSRHFLLQAKVVLMLLVEAILEKLEEEMQVNILPMECKLDILWPTT